MDKNLSALGQQEQHSDRTLASSYKVKGSSTATVVSTIREKLQENFIGT
jgi:hypothetical protein